jgi:hypothetical protein
MNRPMAAISSLTLEKLPRWMACRVIIEKKTSTRFSHDSDVRVKCRVIRGLRGQPGPDGGVFVGGVVVDHQVQLPHASGRCRSNNYRARIHPSSATNARR